MKLALRFAAIVVSMVLAPGWCAQQPAPLIRATSRLVLLDVVVTDKAGHPIHDLKQNDFSVWENGVPQKITSFEAAGVAGGAPSAVAAPSGDGAMKSPASGTAPPDAGSRTILLLDQLNTSFADLAYARDSMLQFIDTNPAADRPTALMSIEPRGLVVAQDYTRDRKLLREKLLHLKALNVNAKGNMDVYWASEYAQDALSDLIQIARASAGAPYSVNVIWVTGGFAGLLSPNYRNDQLDGGMRRITNLLIRSRMRLYTINPAGVVPKIGPNGIAAGVDMTRGSILDAGQSVSDKLANASGNGQSEADELLSRMTRMMGGKSYYGRNDVVVALNEAALDGASAYVISYSPSNEDFRGEYRKIEVRTNVDGSAARTRPGYYAIADEGAADQQLTEQRLQAAMASSLTYSGVDLACPATFDGQQNRLIGKLMISPKPMFAASDAREQIIRITSFSKDGKTLNAWNSRVNWKDPWTNRVVTASFNKELAPKATRVRFLVSDATADRIGSCEYSLR